MQKAGNVLLSDYPSSSSCPSLKHQRRRWVAWLLVYTMAAPCFLCTETSGTFRISLLWRLRHDPEDQVAFKWSCVFCFCFFLFLISYLYLHSRSPCPSPSWPPCEQVPHLSFGCCADGSLLVVYNRPKVSVPHAISTLKLPHYSCPILILFLGFFFFFCKTIPQHASGQRMLSRWYGGFILGGSSKKPQIKHRGR